MTNKGSVTLSVVQLKGHKVLQWRSVRNGKLVTRILRVRIKTDKKGMAHKQYVLAGGSDAIGKALFFSSAREQTHVSGVWLFLVLEGVFSEADT